MAPRREKATCASRSWMVLEFTSEWLRKCAGFSNQSQSDKTNWSNAKPKQTTLNLSFTYCISVIGFRPHVVYNNLHRSKLDANREINESTLNVPDAITAYHNYTNFINKAKSAISGRGLLLDVHGHGHTLQRTELGYLISGSNLDSGNYDASGSSIKSLVEHRCKGDRACFKEFIHGNRSLGHFMNQEDVQAVPSPQNKTPDGNSYFSGGYTVKTYGSRDGGNIDAIQMEFPRSLRTGWNNDTKYELARAIASFFDLNYDIHEATTQSPTSSPTKRSRTTKRTGTTPSKGNITVIQQNNTCVARVLFGMSIIVLSFLFKLS